MAVVVNRDPLRVREPLCHSQLIRELLYLVLLCEGERFLSSQLIKPLI